MFLNIPALFAHILRSDDGGVHSKAYVTGYQNQWGANEANLESLLQYGPVATNIKVRTSGEPVRPTWELCSSMVQLQLISR